LIDFSEGGASAGTLAGICSVLRLRHRGPAPTQPSQQRPATWSRHPRLGEGLVA